MALVWGVTSIVGDQAGSIEDRFRESLEACEAAGELRDGDRIVFTGGVAGSMPGSTNLLQVHTLGDEG